MKNPPARHVARPTELPTSGHGAAAEHPVPAQRARPAGRGVCPACGGQLQAWRSVPSAEPQLGPARYDLHRCSACGTAVTIGEHATQLHETGAYTPGAPRLSRIAAPVLRAFDRQRLDLLVQTAPPPAKLLDAGAGRGRFVASALAAGYDATGIEPSERGASAATAAAIPVTRAAVEEASVDPGSLDVVTLWHVLEHIGDPVTALARIAAWLKPGGVLLVGVPNLASMQARIGGERWYHFDVPRHRVHYTPRGLDALLVRAGFSPVAAHHVLGEHNPFGMWQSAVSRLTEHPSYLYNLLKRNAPARSRDLAITLLALPLAPVAGVAELAAGLAGAGGTMAVLARRAG